MKEAQNREQNMDKHVDNIPILSVSDRGVSHLVKRNYTLRGTDGLVLVRSLNEKQLSVFYQVRQWNLDKMNGRKPDPLLLTGRAGCGKSH